MLYRFIQGSIQLDNENNVRVLDRYLAPIDVWAMAFGCAVGWGALVMPGTTFLKLAGPAGTIIAMAVGTAFMLIIGACFSYLIKRSTRTGGVYTYTKEAFGRDHAFLCSWFLCLSYLTVVFLNGSALFVVIRTLIGDSLRSGITYHIAGNTISIYEVALSAVALVVIGLMFVFTKPLLQRINTFSALVLLAGTVIITAICLPKVSLADVTSSFGTMNISRFHGISSLVILAPWAFVGFEVVSFDTAHFKFDEKKAGSLIFAAIICAGLAYVTYTLVSISAVPRRFGSWQEYINSIGSLEGIESVASFYAARRIMGTPGLVLIAVSAFAAIITGIIGGYRAMMRLLSTMAEDRILSEKFNETKYSIFFIMALSVLISMLGRNTLTWFVDLTSFGAIVAYCYTTAATSKLARLEGRRDIALIGMVGAAISGVFILVQIVPSITAVDAMGSEAFLLLSLWCLLGFVFYWRTVERSELTEYSGLSVSGIMLFSLLVYSAFMWIAKSLYAKDSLESVRSTIRTGGVRLLLIVFIGLVIMLYIQNLVRKKNEAVEREKIRAVEGSLAKSQFLFNMSHDIRTPMNAIIGYTNLAKEEERSPQVLEYLNKIESSSNHLLDLINDILEMSRIESGRLELEYEPTDIIKVFDEIETLFSEQMKKKGLKFSVHTSLVNDRYVWCDRKNLNRILLNTISNAYKFTPEGGKIDVTLSEKNDREDGYSTYEIRVRDTGIGMSREFVDKMFNAFERERSSTVSGIEGTGLGLRITKSIVDLMGGNIEVLTSPGSGTQFIISVKMRAVTDDEIKEMKEDSAADTAGTADFTKKRLLVVEDNRINMEISRMILSKQGFMIDTAENGQIAVDKVASSEPGYYDAILMDIQMPVMDGNTATRMIRNLDNEKLASIPILAMTANAFKEDRDAAIRAGMNAHIAKPIDVDILMEELKKVL